MNTRRAFLKTTGAALAASLLPSCSWQGARPNILFILVDDMGWNDLSHHGARDVSTPNIDRIFQQGIELTNYYTHCVCTPSRAGIQTGRYHWNVGIHGNAEKGGEGNSLSPEYPTIAAMLSNAGYKHRGLFGKWHLGQGDRNFAYHPLNHGYTEFSGFHPGSIDHFNHWGGTPFAPAWYEGTKPHTFEGSSTAFIADRTITFIDKARATSPNNPWFAFMSINAPHTPLQAEPQDLNATLGTAEVYPESQMYGLWVSDRQNYGTNNRQTYAAMMRGIDRAVGKMFAHLEKLGILNDTCIIFASDNGGYFETGADNAPLRGGKTTLLQGGVKVPAAFHWPNSGIGLNTKKIAQDTSYIDWYPSLADIAGLGPVPTDGRTFYSSWFAKKRSLYFYEYRAGTPPANIIHGAVLTPDWKLVARYHTKLHQNPEFTYMRLYRRIQGDVFEDVDAAPAFPEVVAQLRAGLFAKTPYHEVPCC